MLYGYLNFLGITLLITDDYALKERIAIKMDSHISEREATRQAKQEMEEPESIRKLKALQERKKLDDAERHSKKARRIYD